MFSHASHHTNDERVPFAHGMQCLQAVIYFLLGIVAHRAGIKEHGISFIQLFSHLIACHLHDRSNDLAICHIHLTSVRLNKEFFCSCNSRF